MAGEIWHAEHEAAKAEGCALCYPEVKENAICECYLECGADSHSGQWHTHEGEPCPVHLDAVMVG